MRRGSACRQTPRTGERLQHVPPELQVRGLEFVRGQRLVDEIALNLGAFELPENGKLLRGLHALGDGLHAEAGRHVDDGADQRPDLLAGESRSTRLLST